MMVGLLLAVAEAFGRRRKHFLFTELDKIPRQGELTATRRVMPTGCIVPTVSITIEDR